MKIEDVIGTIPAPSIVERFSNLNNFVNWGVQAIFFFATLIFVFMILISGVEWILSGGDKEKVGAAKSRLTNAIIGITLLAISFALLHLLGNLLGFEFFKGGS